MLFQNFLSLFLVQDLENRPEELTLWAVGSIVVWKVVPEIRILLAELIVVSLQRNFWISGHRNLTEVFEEKKLFEKFLPSFSLEARS